MISRYFWFYYIKRRIEGKKLMDKLPTEELNLYLDIDETNK